ncbi:hypothetical protein CU097_000102, partial [Rhizopus azygosporus]
PVAYIKVVAVKKLVVELQVWRGGPPHGVHCLAGPYLLVVLVFKAGNRPNTLAWNNRIGRAVLFCWFLGSPGEILRLTEDQQLRKHLPRTFSLIKNEGIGPRQSLTGSAPYEKSKSLGSGGSMVARLKLKGIDGRAPPG